MAAKKLKSIKTTGKVDVGKLIHKITNMGKPSSQKKKK